MEQVTVEKKLNHIIKLLKISRKTKIYLNLLTFWGKEIKEEINRNCDQLNYKDVCCASRVGLLGQ